MSLMCYAFLCSGSEKSRSKPEMSEVSTQFMSWRELTDVLTARDLPLRPSCRKARLVAMAVVKAILKFLSQWGRKACRTIQDQSKSHGRTQITFFIQKKCYRVSWDKRASTKIRLGFLWIKIMAPGEKQWQNGGEFGHNHTTAAGSGIAFLARLRGGKRAQR